MASSCPENKPNSKQSEGGENLGLLQLEAIWCRYVFGDVSKDRFKEGEKLRKELIRLADTLLARVNCFRRDKERAREERLRHLRCCPTAGS